MRGFIRCHRNNAQIKISPYRIMTLAGFFGLLGFFIIWRLFMLQVIEHKTYTALASGQYEIFKKLFPKRGSVYIHDDERMLADDALYPLATNKMIYEVFAQPKFIDDPEAVAAELFEIFKIEDEDEQQLILAKLNKADDPYEPIKKKVEQSVVNIIKERDVTGIGFRQSSLRYYPENELASNILGFVRLNDQQQQVGQYGIEGYFNEVLAGKQGHLRSERDAFGRWIAMSDRDFMQAEDGADLVLTVNKSIQYVACKKIAEALERFEAIGASLVIMNPQTGGILAMCNYPTFNPNVYNKVEDITYFNNASIFNAYEPGSIFKPITLAASLDQKKITPSTVYHDTGAISYNNAGKVETNPAKIIHTLKNYENKVHGDKTMTEILEYSINTGTVYAMQQIGQKKFAQYVRDFGFGQLTGIGMDSESAGDIRSLDKKGEIFSATGAFGQGITTTPLQMAASYAVFANGGKLMRPYIVEEIRHADGTIEKTEPEVLRQPISGRTASLMQGMLISVVDSGHAKHAAVPGFYIGGKTGTAQVAERGIYGENTIHSFVGFGPANDAKFVMIVRIDHPQKGKSSASTAAVVFGEIAQYLVDYYRLTPER